MAIASGTRATLAYVREATRGTTPAGVTVAVTSLDSAVGAAGFGIFNRASGSFVTDGFVAGQWIKTTGFTTAANNGTWRISSVSALQLIVEDSADAITLEAVDAAQQCVILMTTLRATSRNINLQKNILESAEVRSDRQKSDVRHGFNRVEGSPGFELSLASYDEFLELVCGRAWKAIASVTPGNIGSHTSGYFSRASGSWINDGFRAGDIIRTAGFVATANNGDWRVASVTALNLTVVIPAGVTIATEAASGTPTIVYPGKRLDIGSVLSTITMERRFEDVSRYQVFKGVAIDQMTLSVQPEAIVGGSFPQLGMSAVAMATSPLSSVDPVAAGTNSPFAAFDGAVYEAAAIIAVMTGLDFTLANNGSLNPVIGSRYSPDVFQGTCDITGTVLAYFQDETLLNKFINETESSIWLKLQDPNTSTSFISLVFPRVKYNGGDMDPPQLGPVPISMPFRALVSAALADTASGTVASSLTIQRSNTY